MKTIFSLMLIGMGMVNSWANAIKLTQVVPSGDFIRRGELFDLTLRFQGDIVNVSAIAIELKPLTSDYQYPIAYVKGDFFKGGHISDNLEYHFKHVLIPKEAPAGWWRIDVIIIKNEAYQKLNDPFLYETVRAFKVRD